MTVNNTPTNDINQKIEKSTAKLVYMEQEKAVLNKLLTEVTQLADAAEKRVQNRK